MTFIEALVQAKANPGVTYRSNCTRDINVSYLTRDNSWDIDDGFESILISDNDNWGEKPEDEY